jgi:hypothetical protein
MFVNHTVPLHPYKIWLINNDTISNSSEQHQSKRNEFMGNIFKKKNQETRTAQQKVKHSRKRSCQTRSHVEGYHGRKG